MRSFRRRLLAATALTATAALVSSVTAVTTAGAVAQDVNALLAEQLRQAVVAQDFRDVLDLTPP